MLELMQGKYETIRLKGRTIKYRVRRSASAKRRRLQVSPAGVVVVLPVKEPMNGATSFIKQNGLWITEEMKALSRRASSIGGTLPKTCMLIGGITVPVIRKVTTEAHRISIDFDGTRLTVSGKGPGADQAMERWLRRLARREISIVVADRAKAMGVKPRRIFIRGQRTKWGNCSRLRNLSFNWRLAMVPPGVLRYLVIHELAHLKEMSHGPKFWLIVQQACPDVAQHQEWLRTNAHRLSLPPLER